MQYVEYLFNAVTIDGLVLYDERRDHSGYAHSQWETALQSRTGWSHTQNDPCEGISKHNAKNAPMRYQQLMG